MGIAGEDPVSKLSLPPGFRFYPTDEELLVQYLCRKVAGQHFSLQLIAEIDLYKFDPWILPSKAVFGEKEWYFFSPRDRKYPNGSRPNRVAGSGYWKATGTDKIITTEGRKIGIKKALVFYIGKAPKGTKTNWIMHEYRVLESSRKNGSSRLDDWVLCRVYKKNSSASHQKLMNVTNIAESREHGNNCSYSSASTQFDDVLESLPEIEDRSFALPRVNSLRALQDQKLNFNNSTGKLDFWSNFPAAVTEFGVNSGQNHNQPFCYDVCNPLPIPPLTHPDSPSEKFGSSIEEEVESGLGGLQRLDDSGLFKSNSGGLAQLYSDSVDPFGLRYLMTQQQQVSQGRFGYGQ